MIQQSRLRRGSPFKEMREALQSVMKPTGVQRWSPRRPTRACFFNPVTRAVGTNAVAEPFTTCITGRQLPKAAVPTPPMKKVESRIDVRLAGLQERVDAQLRTLGDQITRVSLKLAPMQRMLMRSDESCAMVSSLTEEGAGNPARCGRDLEKHNVTEAMVQIRERSRWARRTGSDGEDSCDHVQNTARGMVSRAPSRRSSKRSSAGKAPFCKNLEHHEPLKNTQVEDAVEVIASLTQQSAQSDSSLRTASAAREKETQDSSKSEAEHLNDTL